MKKNKLGKRIVTFALAVATVLGAMVLPASAANYTTNYSAYNQPESNDYAYWNGRRVVRGSGTTTSEVKWMQAAMNALIQKRGLNAPYAEVDGSFGPNSARTCRAIQGALGLQQDSSFGPATIAAVKSALSSASAAGGTIQKQQVTQTDSRWRYTVVGTMNMQDSACGPTSVSSAVLNCSGKWFDPVSVATWANQNGWFNIRGRSGGVCDNTIFTAAAKKYGVRYCGSGSGVDQRLKNHLSGGSNRSAIIWVYNHYMVLGAYDPGSDRFLVLDTAPNCGNRRGLTSYGGDWKSSYDLSWGSIYSNRIKIRQYWLYEG